MIAHAKYTINFYGETEDIKKTLPVIKNTLHYDFSDIPEEMEVEDTSLIWLEEIVDKLAVNMAKAAPELIYTIDGTIETPGSGEFLDFSISYCERKITIASFPFIFFRA